MARISIVMANHNRRNLLINTLKTIEYYNRKRDIEVIIVDDNSKKSEDVTDVPELFNIPVIIIPITKDEKTWIWDGIVFNIGFRFITGKIVIIQNPENIHVGDIIGHALKNIRDGVFLSYALYSTSYHDSDRIIKNSIAKGLYSGENIKNAVGTFVGKKENWTDGDTCWYNHSVFRVSGCHLISAITRKDLEDMHGFDERYSPMFAYSDVEFKERLRKKNMVTYIIDEPFAIHQRHDLAAYGKNKTEFEMARDMFVMCTQKEKTYRAPQNYFYRPTFISKFGDNERIMVCPISNDSEPVRFLNLGWQPLVNNLCNTRQDSLNCERFPLGIQIFPKSMLTCLTDIVNKDSLFLNYTYQSGVNKPFLIHCREMYDYIDCIHKFKKNDLVMDVGGNDGSLLMQFRDKNPHLHYINVDASESFIEINKKAGIEYINRYFDDSFHLKDKADFIISTNVFQHTLPIRSFVAGIFNNLKDNGMWCLEFPYWLTTMMNDNYDQVYHEHVFYFILENIIDLASQEGLKVINVSFWDIHAGTMRVLLVKNTDPRKTDTSVGSFLNLEKQLTTDFCRRWGRRTLFKIQEFRKFIDNLKAENKVIFGFGAAAKGCVFLNTVGIDYETIPYIIDDTPFKQDKFIPGTGIQVVSREILKKTKPDYLLILAHNFRDYIIESLKDEYDGKYIIMFPDIKII